MKKRNVKVLPKAERDLGEIRDYLLKHTSTENTERVLDWAWRTITDLEDMADIHPAIEREGLAEGVRGVLIHTYSPEGIKRGSQTRWMVFYRITGPWVEVLRVRHTSQNPVW